MLTYLQDHDDDDCSSADFLRFMAAGATSKTIATCIAYPHGESKTIATYIAYPHGKILTL